MKIEENALIDNSLGIQSRCKLLVKLQNTKDLNKIHDLIKSNKKYFIHGEGTNIVPPSYYDGLVLKADFNHINLNKNILNVGSAYNWTELVKFCIKNDINGFENLIDIPGSVGASPVQNIGAYGVDVSSLIDSIDCFCLKTFKEINLNNKDCKFSYRDSILKNSHYLIYNLNFKSNLKEEKFGFAILPANNTLLQFFCLIKLIIVPNFPILILKVFSSLLNLFFFEKSIMKYLIFCFFIFLRTTSEKSVSPKNKPIILF